MRRVGLVRMEVLSEPDPDEAPLLGALRSAGFEACSIVWTRDDEPEHNPANYDLCIIRATWDYYKQPGRFMQWVWRASRVTSLCNDARAVAWNLHKSYLFELESRGVPIVPTRLVHRGFTGNPRDVLRVTGWPSFVVKPAISAASWMTSRFDDLGGAADFLASILRERDALVQPVIPEFARGGEVCIVWIDGEVTHAIRKQPRFSWEDERVIATTLTDAHREFAARVIEAARVNPLYARVDVVEMADGTMLLSELELIEPSLFFVHSPDAARRMASSLRGRL